MTQCKKCASLVAILKDVKTMMDSDHYQPDFDTLYDRISTAVQN